MWCGPPVSGQHILFCGPARSPPRSPPATSYPQNGRIDHGLQAVLEGVQNALSLFDQKEAHIPLHKVRAVVVCHRDVGPALAEFVRHRHLGRRMRHGDGVREPKHVLEVQLVVVEHLSQRGRDRRLEMLQVRQRRFFAQEELVNVRCQLKVQQAGVEDGDAKQRS